MSQEKKWFRFVKKTEMGNVYDDLDVQYVCKTMLEGVLGITDFSNNSVMEYYPGGKYPLSWYQGSQSIGNLGCMSI